MARSSRESFEEFLAEEGPCPSTPFSSASYKKSPLSLMGRLLMQRALSSEWLGELFEAQRQRQYTRELLLITEVDLMALVQGDGSGNRLTPR